MLGSVFAVLVRPLCATALPVAIACLFAVAPALAGTPPDPAGVQRTGRAVVLLRQPSGAGSARETRAAASTRSAAERLGLRRAGAQASKLAALTVELPPSDTLGSLRRRLLADPAVVSVEPEYRRSLADAPSRLPRFMPNDPSLTTTDSHAPQNALAQWYMVRENFPAAWNVARGSGVKLAIVDTGIDGAHPDLSGQIEAANDLDPTLLGTAANHDDNGHGTHVSGLACAKDDNGFGIVGGAPECRLVIEKSDLSDTSIAAAIVDATDRGAKVISMSLGGPGESDVISRAIDYAVAHDVVPVSAAANEPTTDQGIPASLLQPVGTGSDIEAGRGLVVTAAAFDDKRAPFAGRGSGISLAAYGDTTPDTLGILSSFPGNGTELERGNLLAAEPPCLCRTTFTGDSRFAYLVGTSMAVPQVAGAVATVRSLNPKITAKQTIRLIKLTARRSGGYSDDLGWGILDAGAALKGAILLESDKPNSRVRTTSRTRSRSFSVRVTASDLAVGSVPATGVAKVEVYRAARGRGFKLIRTIPASDLHDGTATFAYRGAPGGSYRFYSKAVDVAGNSEDAPPRPDSTTKVLRPRG